MAWDIGDWSWAWVLSHAGVWALVLARVLGLCLTAPALAIPELDWRFRLGLAAIARHGPDSGAGAVDRAARGLVGHCAGAGARGAHRWRARLVGRLDRGRSPPGGRAGRRAGGALDRDAPRPRDRRGA